MVRSGLIGLVLAVLLAAEALAQATNATRELTATFGRTGGEELRLALVIGNSANPDAPLRNPANDARLLSETLNAVGFAVTEVVDADWRAMKRAIQDFGRQLDLAGDNAVGLFYYAGHGIQVGESNYLVPVGAPIATEADVGIEAVSAQSVLAQMEYARNRLNIVILDACRNNPYRRSFRSAPNGLTKMEVPSGSLLAFATAPGDVAADGAGDNSPYALALAAAMAEPGLDVLPLFREVRVRVRETVPRQVPWFESSLDGEFYFTPGAPASPPAAETTPTAPYDRDADIAFWNSIVDEDDLRLFRAYLTQFPDGIFAAIARIRIEALRQEAAAPPAPVAEEPPAAPVAETPPAVDAVETLPAPPVAAPETTVAALPAEELTPAEVEARLDLSREERRLVQHGLNAFGHDAGAVDGLFGAGSRGAIERWQAASGNDATGYLTAPQAQTLIAAGRDDPVSVAVESKLGRLGITAPEDSSAVSAVPGRLPNSQEGAVWTPKGEIGEGWVPVVDVEGTEIYELGLELAALTPEIRTALDLGETTTGLLITDIRSSGRSAKKDLEFGDVIERVNRQAMTKPAEVINEITLRLREGRTTLRLDVRKRDGALWTVLVSIN